jgi:hypothetical protein
MQTEAQRLNRLRLLVARVRDRRLERLMTRVRRQRERSQSRCRDRLFEEARQLIRQRAASTAA